MHAHTHTDPHMWLTGILQFHDFQIVLVDENQKRASQIRKLAISSYRGRQYVHIGHMTSTNSSHITWRERKLGEKEKWRTSRGFKGWEGVTHDCITKFKCRWALNGVVMGRTWIECFFEPERQRIIQQVMWQSHDYIPWCNIRWLRNPLRNSWQTRRERKTSTTNGSPVQRGGGRSGDGREWEKNNFSIFFLFH